MSAKYLNYFFWFVMAVLTIISVGHTTHHDLDFQVFYRTGEQFLAGNFDFYNLERDANWTYRYGPLFPAFMAPLAWLSKDNAQLLFAVLNSLAFPLAWFLSERVLARRIGEIITTPGVRFLTLLLVIDYVNRNANQGNVNVFMFLALIAAIDLSDRGHSFFAGSACGFGAMVKVYPGAAALYFLCSRRWLDFIWATVMTIMFTFALPALIYGPLTLIHQIESWAAVLQDRSYYPFFKYINQAPVSVVWRVSGSESLGKSFHMIFNFVAALLLGYLVALSVRTKSEDEELRLDLPILLLSTVMPLFVLTCVFTEYHVIATPLIMTANAFLLHGRLSRSWKAVYWLRFAFVNLAVLAIVGRAVTEEIGAWGNHLFGVVALLLLVYFTMRNFDVKTMHEHA